MTRQKRDRSKRRGSYHMDIQWHFQMSLVGRMFQRIVTCPADFTGICQWICQWHFPMDVHACEIWCATFRPDASSARRRPAGLPRPALAWRRAPPAPGPPCPCRPGAFRLGGRALGKMSARGAKPQTNLWSPTGIIMICCLGHPIPCYAMLLSCCRPRSGSRRGHAEARPPTCRADPGRVTCVADSGAALQVQRHGCTAEGSFA